MSGNFPIIFSSCFLLKNRIWPLAVLLGANRWEKETRRDSLVTLEGHFVRFWRIVSFTMSALFFLTFVEMLGASSSEEDDDDAQCLGDDRDDVSEVSERSTFNPFFSRSSPFPNDMVPVTPIVPIPRRLPIQPVKPIHFIVANHFDEICEMIHFTRLLLDLFVLSRFILYYIYTILPVRSSSPMGIPHR